MNKLLALLCVSLALSITTVSQQAGNQTTSATSSTNGCTKFNDIGAETQVCIYKVTGSATQDIDIDSSTYNAAQILFVSDSPNVTVSIDPAAKGFPPNCPKDPFANTPHGKKANSVLTGRLTNHPANTSCPYTFTAVTGDGTSTDPTLFIN